MRQKERAMSKTTLFALFFVAFAMGTSNPVLAQASAGECKIYTGGGGERVFPEWSDNRKVMVVPYGEKASVWLPASCNNGSGKWAVGYPKAQLDVTNEVTSELAKGVRLTFTAKPGTGRSAVKVIVDTPARSFELEVRLGPTYDEASTASLRADIASLRKETGDLRAGLADVDGRSKSAYTKSEEANGKADAALRTAHEAKSRTEAGVEVEVAGIYNFETPGSWGGGLKLQATKTWGFANDKIFLGLGGRLTWNRYELELLGASNVNNDVFGMEWDLSALFHFMWRPVSQFGLFAETGFGLRFFQHDDAVSSQDDQLYLKGVEGRFSAHGLWTASVGFKVYPLRSSFYISVALMATVALNKQANHPSGDDDVPARFFNVWNVGAIAGFGFCF